MYCILILSFSTPKAQQGLTSVQTVYGAVGFLTNPISSKKGLVTYLVTWFGLFSWLSCLVNQSINATNLPGKKIPFSTGNSRFNFCTHRSQWYRRVYRKIYTEPEKLENATNTAWAFWICVSGKMVLEKLRPRKFFPSTLELRQSGRFQIPSVWRVFSNLKLLFVAD